MYSILYATHRNSWLHRMAAMLLPVEWLPIPPAWSVPWASAGSPPGRFWESVESPSPRLKSWLFQRWVSCFLYYMITHHTNTSLHWRFIWRWNAFYIFLYNKFIFSCKLRSETMTIQLRSISDSMRRWLVSKHSFLPYHDIFIPNFHQAALHAPFATWTLSSCPLTCDTIPAALPAVWPCVTCYMLQ